jgi:hypothetical protein
LLLSTLAILASVGAINRFVDPFGAFATTVNDRPQEAGLFGSNTRLAKAHVVSRFRPEAIILGSSRAEVGLSAAHEAWQYERVYNLGLPQASIAEILEYYEHAIAAGSLKQAVLGLDFYQFNPMLEPRPDFDACRLRNPGSAWTRWRAALCDMPALLLSRRALGESIAQLRGRSKEADYLRDGSRNELAKEAEFRRAGYQHAAFLDSEFSYLNRIDLLGGFRTSNLAFEETAGPRFEALLRLSYEHGVDLRLFISPSHARQFELIREMGLWDEFVRWKRFLLATATSIAAEYASEPFPIWDLADYNVFSQEALPPLEDREARMKWYWESSHYNRSLGQRVLNLVLAGRDEGIGRQIEADDIDSWLAALELRRAKYARAAENDLALMRDYLASPTRRESIQKLFEEAN